MLAAFTRSRGGIGIRGGLKYRYREICEFDSHREHQLSGRNSVGRMRDLGSRCREFESPRSDQWVQRDLTAECGMLRYESVQAGDKHDPLKPSVAVAIIGVCTFADAHLLRRIYSLAYCNGNSPALKAESG